MTALVNTLLPIIGLLSEVFVLIAVVSLAVSIWRAFKATSAAKTSEKTLLLIVALFYGASLHFIGPSLLVAIAAVSLTVGIRRRFAPKTVNEKPLSEQGHFEPLTEDDRARLSKKLFSRTASMDLNEGRKLIISGPVEVKDYDEYTQYNEKDFLFQAHPERDTYFIKVCGRKIQVGEEQYHRLRKGDIVEVALAPHSEIVLSVTEKILFRDSAQSAFS